MKLPDTFGPAQEYEALRTELQESRSYVFERPLLILGAVAGVAAFGAEKMKDGEYMALLPPLITALMIYNLWSTAWRQSTSSRIVAYIQIAFEERTRYGREWWGWETCLRVYRNDHEGEVETCVNKMMEARAKSDPLMYWRVLWYLHIVIVFLAVVVSLALPFFHGCVWPDLLGFVVNPLLATGFGYVCWNYHPKKMGFQIECECDVWKKVLDELDERGARSRNCKNAPPSSEPGP